MYSRVTLTRCCQRPSGAEFKVDDAVANPCERRASESSCSSSAGVTVKVDDVKLALCDIIGASASSFTEDWRTSDLGGYKEMASQARKSSMVN